MPAAISPIELHPGLPYGIQIVGGYREDLVPDTAASIEKQVGGLPGGCVLILALQSYPQTLFGGRNSLT